MRAALLAICILFSVATAPATAEVISVRLYADRGFGLFVGDLVKARLEIVADSGLHLQTASLPRPGVLDYWLDLRDARVRAEPAGDGITRWSVDLTYQLFYVALDVRELRIPSFPLRFTRDGATETVEAPAWPITVSPLREVLPQKRDDPTDYMRPDRDVARMDATTSIMRAGALLTLAAGALALVARDRAWPPFHRRRARVFAAASRRVAGLVRRDDEAARREVLLTLHRAIDTAAAGRVFGEDIGAFLSAHPEFSSARAGLERFFSTSRAIFFGVATEDAVLSSQQIASLAKELAEAERRAR